MRSVLREALLRARGSAPGSLESPAGKNYGTERLAGNATSPAGADNGAASWRGGKTGPIPGGSPLSLATTPPKGEPKALSKGSGGGPGASRQGQPSNPDAKGGKPKRTGNHGHGPDENHEVRQMFRSLGHAVVRNGKIMENP